MQSGGLVWIPLTLGATIAQVFRTARQHELRQFLSSSGAAYVRFLFAWPLAVLWGLLTWLRLPEGADIQISFWLWSAMAGLVQIICGLWLLECRVCRVETNL